LANAFLACHYNIRVIDAKTDNANFFLLLHMSNTLNRPIRVLVAKVGLDGHDRGAKIIATTLRDAGMEVIYTGLRQTPEMVVNAALQEDVDAIGISILSGAHMTVFPKLTKLMKGKGMGDVLLTGGGIIPPDDIKALNDMGVGRLFAPGTNTKEIVDYIKKWVAVNRQF
jgi:methylmalonyl-CoA mutase C-terminal domain/subunit